MLLLFWVFALITFAIIFYSCVNKGFTLISFISIYRKFATKLTCPLFLEYPLLGGGEGNKVQREAPFFFR